MPLLLRANSSGHAQGERLFNPLTVLVIFFAFVTVLVLLFPERGLLKVLVVGDDVVSLRYREALLRVYPGDMELRLKVAGSFLCYGNSRRALDTLDLAPTRLTPEQRRVVVELRYGALQDLFQRSKPGTDSWQSLKPKVVSAARELAGPNPPVWRLNQLAADAHTAGDLETWNEYRRHIKTQAMLAKAGTSSPDAVAQALARRDYRTAAAICFAGMDHAGSIEQRRQLFMRGVSALQSGNLPQEALAASERHLDDLSEDRTTLVFLTKVSLAANQPDRAQVYIKKALGMKTVPIRASSS